MFYPLHAWHFCGDVVDEEEFWLLDGIAISIYMHMGFWCIVFFPRVTYLCKRNETR